jgi:hypothetical protein
LERKTLPVEAWKKRLKLTGWRKKMLTIKGRVVLSVSTYLVSLYRLHVGSRKEMDFD